MWIIGLQRKTIFPKTVGEKLIVLANNFNVVHQRLPLLLPTQQAAAVAGFLAAFGYSLLAGFEVQAQRTLYMLGVVALAL